MHIGQDCTIMGLKYLRKNDSGADTESWNNREEQTGSKPVYKYYFTPMLS